MAIEPYRPQNGPNDREKALDQRLERLFDRWPYKLMRAVRWTAIGIFVIWLLGNVLPATFTFLTTQELGPLLLQLLSTMAYLFIFIGFQFALMYFFMARTRIYWVRPGETGISFADYRGNPEVLEAARRIVTLLKGAKQFKQMGGEITRGVLLIGPPGTGKSYLAQAISTEAGVPFGYLSAPSLTSVWMGMGNIKVMMLFRKARKLAKEYGACILFIDEIDAIGMARSTSLMGGNATGMSGSAIGGQQANMVMGMGGAGSGLLNELLLQMDPPPEDPSWWGKILRSLGLRRKKPEMPPVLTMGATNLAETLDAALLRPGRFDRKIVVEYPDADGRRDIIEYYLGKVKHEPMPMDRMVSDTINYTPVAIRFIINEAVIHAHFDNRQAINYWDFSRAREMHEYGLRQPIRGMSFEERRRIAYHEAGHAYAAVKLLRKQRLTKVTIIRHGNALGFAAWKPEEEIYTQSKEELLGRLQIALASRGAEELFLGIQMSGVTGDLASATGIATYMVGAYGMDNSFYSYLAFGPEAMRGGDMKKQVEAILAEEYRKVKHLLEQNRHAVIAIAEALILRNELTDIDVNDILLRVEAAHPFTNAPLPVPTTALPVDTPSETVVDSSAAATPATPAPSATFTREPEV